MYRSTAAKDTAVCAARRDSIACCESIAALPHTIAPSSVKVALDVVVSEIRTAAALLGFSVRNRRNPLFGVANEKWVEIWVVAQ